MLDLFIFLLWFWARVTFFNAADEVGAFESVTLVQNPSHRLHFGVPRSGAGFRLFKIYWEWIIGVA